MSVCTQWVNDAAVHMFYHCQQRPVIWGIGLYWMGWRGFVQQVRISGGYLVCHVSLIRSCRWAYLSIWQGRLKLAESDWTGYFTDLAGQVQRDWKREEEAASRQEQALPKAAFMSAIELCPVWVTQPQTGEEIPRCPRDAQESKWLIQSSYQGRMSRTSLVSVNTAETGERRKQGSPLSYKVPGSLPITAHSHLTVWEIPMSCAERMRKQFSTFGFQGWHTRLCPGLYIASMWEKSVFPTGFAQYTEVVCNPWHCSFARCFMVCSSHCSTSGIISQQV